MQKGAGGIAQLVEARVALVGTLVFSTAIIMQNKPLGAFLSILPPLFPLCFSVKNWRLFLTRLQAPFVFLFFMCAFLPFTIPGPVVWEWGILSLSSTGIWSGILIFLKCAALIATFTALLAPLSLAALASALHWLHCPAPLSGIFLLMDMNVHIITREWKSLKTATLLRGFKASTSMHTYRTFAAMLALLIIRANNRARRCWEGMLLKGFSGDFPVRALPPFTIRERLQLFFIICLAIFLILLSLAGI